MHSKAIEAIARGLCDNSPYNDDTWQDYVPEATAALTAYHAHLEAEGFGFVQTRQIGVTSGPPIYDPRPNVKG